MLSVEVPCSGLSSRDDASWFAVSDRAAIYNDHRSVYVYFDGRVVLHESLSFNGPGPWLSYWGNACLAPALLRELLTALDAAPVTATDGACVIEIHRAGKTWKGCAYASAAKRVLASAGRLSPPAIAPTVRRIEFDRERWPHYHERFGEIEQRVLLDENGVFWCARKGPAARQANDLRVARGRIRADQAAAVFHWLLGDAGRSLTSPPGHAPYEQVDEISFVGPDGSSSVIAASAARPLRARWQRLAPQLPGECRPSR